MMFMRVVNRWELKGQKVTIDFKPVDEVLKLEFQSIIDEYLNGGKRTFLILEDELDKIKGVSNDCLDVFHHADIFANLWVIGHEVAHAISKDKLSQVIPELVEIRRETAKLVDSFELYPSVANEWEEEFNADLISVLLLYLTEAKRLNMDLADVTAREKIAFRIGSGVALACEAMQHIVRNVYPETSND